MSASRDATRCMHDDGLVVDMSMTTLPGLIAWATPPAPKRRSSSASSSETIVMSTVLTAPTSAAESATRAPSSRRGSAFAGVRFQTVSGKPARARLAAIGPPMSPSPMKPVGAVMVMMRSVVQGRGLRGT